MDDRDNADRATARRSDHFLAQHSATRVGGWKHRHRESRSRNQMRSSARGAWCGFRFERGHDETRYFSGYHLRGSTIYDKLHTCGECSCCTPFTSRLQVNNSITPPFGIFNRRPLAEARDVETEVMSPMQSEGTVNIMYYTCRYHGQSKQAIDEPD